MKCVTVTLGLTEETVEFIHRVAEDSISCAHAVMEILHWIIVQVRSNPLKESTD